MRRRPLAAATVLAVAAGLTVATGGTASAMASCASAGTVPHLVYGQNGIHAEGAFTCSEGHTGMTVTVCIEEQLGLAGPWWSRGCATNEPQAEATATVTAEVVVDVMVYSTLLRTTVVGTNDTGEVREFTSPPVFWFNCACMI